MMNKCLAFVLGGGGARGAMQVGALRALIEAGLKPDLLVGTSIGAVNATGLALWGVSLAGIEALELNALDKALQQARQGRYGICEGCGNPIDSTRLEVLPEATLCITCQRAVEHHGSQYVAAKVEV